MTTIAVIDDAILIDLAEELLGERDWITMSSRDPATAGDFLRRTRPDAILLDVHLGGSDKCWAILEDLKAGPGTRMIPVVVWSGDLRILEHKRAWLEDHHIQVLGKPFEIDDLYRCLDCSLGISATV